MLEEQLRKTQQQIQELKAMMEQQKAIGQATQKQVNDANEQAKTAAEAAKKTASLEIPEWAKRTSVFGDVRFRHEGFYHQPTVKGADNTARNRERIRARLGRPLRLSDELSATIRGASGNINDPVSTNETLTGKLHRRTSTSIGLHHLHAGKTFGMRPGVASITAGKFPNPMFRVSELVFDEDLSPEAFSETFHYSPNRSATSIR